MSTAQPKPVRIQRKRTKGFNLQAASPNGLPVVYVGRPTVWGNPFCVFGRNEYLFCDASHRRKILTPWVIFDHDQDIWKKPATHEMCVVFYSRWLNHEFDEAGIVRPCLMTAESIAELRGKNLACWCPLDQPCHASVLLELANNESEVG